VNIMSTVPRRSARHLDSVSCLVIMEPTTVVHIQRRFHMRETQAALASEKDPHGSGAPHGAVIGDSHRRGGHQG
jgi:hypothetical protein